MTTTINKHGETQITGALEHLPIPLWQADVSKLCEALDSLRLAGVRDFDAFLLGHDGFLEWALGSVTLVAANASAVAAFAGQSAADVVGEPLSRFWPADLSAFRRAICAQYAGSVNFAERIAMRDLRGRSIAIEFAMAFPARGAPSISMIGVAPVTTPDETDDEYRNVFLNTPVPLVRLDLSQNLVLLEELRGQLKKQFLQYVETSASFATQYIDLIRLRDANHAAADLFGLAVPTLFPASVADVWRTSPDTVRRACVARLSGASGYSEETRIDTYDGKVKDVLFSVVFNDRTSASLGNVAAFIDISDRVAAERALQKLRSDFTHAARLALVGELSGSIAHEVIQPLTAITATGQIMARCLDRDHPDLDFVRGLAADVVEDGQRACDIVSRIRAMMAKQAPVRRHSSLNDLIAATIAFLHRELNSGGVQMQFTPAIDLPMVLIDRVQIQQVLVNLTMNAIQAIDRVAGAVRRIAIRTETDNGTGIRVLVSDTGPGVDPAVIATLFDSFVTTRDGGLGIGLAICRSIIEDHGGRIELLENAGGACFAFSLPVQAAVRAD